MTTLLADQPRWDPHLDLGDLVLIELMRSDSYYADFHPTVDMNIPSSVKRKFRQDEKQWLGRLIAERAAKYCEKKQNVNVASLKSQLKGWIYSFAFLTAVLLIFVATFHAMGTTRWLFSSGDNEVSIGHLLWLLIVPPLFCLLPCIACFTLLFRRRGAVTDRPESQVLRIARQFSIPGILAGGLHIWRELRGSANSTHGSSLERFMEQKGHVATILFVTISNAVVLALSLAIFLAVLNFLLFNEVSYSWKSSIATTPAKVKAIKTIARCVPIVNPPSDAAIQWAFSGQRTQIGLGAGETELPPLPHRADTLESYRFEWSMFLLQSMVILGIIPRLLIAGLSAVLVRRSWYELTPDHADPAIEAIVNHVLRENPPTTETTLPEQEPEVVTPPLPNSTPRNRSVHPDLVAYSLSVKETAALRTHAACRTYHLETVDGAAARHAYLSRLQANTNIERVVVFVRATTVPDRAFSSFLRRIVDQVNARHGHGGLVILGAKEHLQRVSGDTHANRARLDLWYRKTMECGIAEVDIFVYDLDAAHDSRARLGSFLSGTVEDTHATCIPLAGKYDKALTYAEKQLVSACRSDSVSSRGEWEAVSDEIREKILKIYDGEYRFLLSSVSADKWRDTAAQIGEKLGLPARHWQSLQQILQFYKFFRRLSPRWIIAGAITGAGAGAALPLILGVSSFGIPMILAAIPISSFGGGIGGAVTAEGIRHFWRSRSNDNSECSADLVPHEGINLDLAARAAFLLVVICEYHNHPHEIITAKVEEHLKPLNTRAITSQEELAKAANALKDSLSREAEK